MKQPHAMINNITNGARMKCYIALFLISSCLNIYGESNVNTSTPEMRHSWVKCIISYDNMNHHYVLIAPSPGEYEENIASNVVILKNLRMGIYQAEKMEVSSEKEKVKLNMHNVYYTGHTFFQSKTIRPWRSEIYTIELNPEDVIYINGMRAMARNIKELINIDTEGVEGPIK